MLQSDLGFQPLHRESIWLSICSLSLSLVFFILSKIHKAVTLSTMEFCGAQFPIR